MVDTRYGVSQVSLLPAAGSMQAGLAAAISATSTGATGCTALVLTKHELVTSDAERG